jgi:protein Tex
VDPAYRTGCKLAVLDEHGTHLDHGVVYPTQPQNDYEGAARTVLDLIRKHHVGAVAIGNGTGSRETQTFFARLNTEEGAGIRFTVVSEAGASVYSASAVAQAEYLELDVTVRGAISIAERLQNPMAALVKIDPQSLGIGQYQHDVDQKLLRESLKQTIEALVNRVGVEVNSASPSLLSYVAGVGPKSAERIVADRRANGPFRSKQEVKRVKGMGDHAFQQCAGFLRIRDGQSVLDNTGVHPESYAVADQILRHVDLTAVSDADIAGLVAQVRGDGTSGPGEIGEATVRDIVTELQKPGFDPRSELPEIPFREGITDISELGEGSMVSGVVRSIVDFGAFVDIGIKNDGLVHISEISEERIGHPMDVLSVNQYLPRIRVIKIDTERGKVGLSLRGV